MKKALLLVALALGSSVCAPTVKAQDTFGIDASGYNHLLNYSQIKHHSPGALDPLSVRNRYLKRKGRARSNRRYRTSRLSKSKSNRRLRSDSRAPRSPRARSRR